jgi:hypothetical protein
MSFHSLVKITGELTVQKFNSNKEIVEEIHIPNLVVNVGKEHIAARMIDDSITKMSHMAIGSGLTTPAASNTTLVNQLARVTVSSLRSSANITYTATFGAGVGTGSVTEAAIFNAETGGDMLCRTIFPVITKSASETISISWTITVG